MNTNFNLELLLREMYEVMSELSLVLDTEYDALKNYDVDNLQIAASQKEELSEKIKQLELSRTDILNSHQLGNDLAAMQNLILQFSDTENSQLYKIWNMISELAIECSEKNMLNGCIIETNRRHTDLAISVLQGNFPQDQTELYDSEGSTISNRKNSTIAKA